MVCHIRVVPTSPREDRTANGANVLEMACKLRLGSGFYTLLEADALLSPFLWYRRGY